jgi:hypothetical protein
LIAGRYWYPASRPARSSRSTSASAAAGPATIASGTARLSATIGDGHTTASRSYSATICRQSVSA